MFFQFLIEDKSGKILVENVMEKLGVDNINDFYECKHFHGIGGLSQKRTAKETKTGKLLNDLAIYLKGFNKSLQDVEDSAVIVVLDNDDRNTEVFRKELRGIAEQCNINIDHVFCIAIEEIEAWLLGDQEALRRAYPHARLSVLQKYEQDGICGTWETLADAVYEGGWRKLKKDCPTYFELGGVKCEWAEKIGRYVDIESNKSPSFQLFISEVRKRMSA